MPGHQTMPPEWAAHERTWMAFPTANETFGDEYSETLRRARRAWARVADAVAKYEPVNMLVAPGDGVAAQVALDDAAACGTGGSSSPGRMPVTLHEVPLDDAWLRDSGPTFVRSAEGGSLNGVDWTFNGWGAQGWSEWVNDQRLATEVTKFAGTARSDSPLVNEGGGIHVDGRGTVLLTETVQLDPDRNPEWDKGQVEAEIHAQLGTSHAIWLPFGLTRDYGEFGTKGHVDIVAAFTPSGAVMLHTQSDPQHPDYEVTRELKEALSVAVDAQGNPLRILEVPAPQTLQDETGYVDWSYINHYVANGVVVLCAFGDLHDRRAAEIIQQEYPRHRMELVDARDIFAFGGGVHCITQQQPAKRAG